MSIDQIWDEKVKAQSLKAPPPKKINLLAVFSSLDSVDRVFFFQDNVNQFCDVFSLILCCSSHGASVLDYAARGP